MKAAHLLVFEKTPPEGAQTTTTTTTTTLQTPTNLGVRNPFYGHCVQGHVK